MAGNNLILLIITSVILCCRHSVSSESVPVYVFETSKITNTVPALEHINVESFKEILLEHLTNNPFIVVFTEQNLSPEDFTIRDTSGRVILSQVSALKTTTHVTYLPSVQNPLGAFQHLQNRKIVEVAANSLLEDIDIKVSKNDILLVDLNDAKDGEDRAAMLRRHDDGIVTIYKDLVEQHKNVLAVITARHSSWVMPEEVRKQRRTRDILAADDAVEGDSSKLYVADHILFYVSSTALLVSNLDEEPLTNYNASSQLANDTLTVSLKKDDNNNLKFDFNILSGYWYLANISGVVNSTAYNLNVPNIYAPDGFSYHCNLTTFSDNSDKKISLVLPGFQVQPFFDNLNNTRFGDAYNCVGFTSIPIWSGLFVTFILALIMTLGLTMMMDIRTMDRFDDPKGKTITINVSE